MKLNFVKVEEIKKGDVILYPVQADFRRVTVVRAPSKKIVNGKTVYSSVPCEYEYNIVQKSYTYGSGRVHTWNAKKEVFEGTGEFKKSIRVDFNSRSGLLIHREEEQ
jgi:hypothetical protein